MTKTELIEAIAKDTNLSKSDASKALNSLIDNITKTVKKGKSVTITGFGSFSRTKRKARTGRNPQTGEELILDARRVVTFKP